MNLCDPALSVRVTLCLSPLGEGARWLPWMMGFGASCLGSGPWHPDQGTPGSCDSWEIPDHLMKYGSPSDLGELSTIYTKTRSVSSMLCLRKGTSEAGLPSSIIWQGSKPRMPLGRWDIEIQSLANSCWERAKKGSGGSQESQPESVS
jgi:hypothetical protein